MSDTHCGKEMKLHKLPVFGGSLGESKITFYDFPVLKCSKCNYINYVYPEFERNLKAEIFENKIIKVIKEGVIEKKFFCNKCRTILDAKKLGRDDFKFEMKLGDGSNFRIELSAPSLRCHECGLVQVHDYIGVYDDIEGAILLAFSSVNLQL